MKRSLIFLTLITTLGLIVSGWCEAPKDSIPGIRLAFDIKATMQDRVVHSQPTILVLDGQQATMNVESDSEEPTYKMELTTVAKLTSTDSVELDNDLTVITARGEWHRRLKFNTLLDTDAEFSFTEDDGTEVLFSVRPSLMETP